MNTKTQHYSLNFGGAVFIILFLLKVLDQIDMHWFWVLTSWIWVPVGALFAGMFLMFCFGAITVAVLALIARL